MQFDRAEFEGPQQSAAGACVICKNALAVSFFTLAGHPICQTCRDAIVAGPESNPVERVLRAAVAGTGAAIAGALLYWGIIAATGFELSLISIAVGWMVGGAVRWGAMRRGGWLYQGLAVYLTYLSVGIAYVGLAIQGGALAGVDPFAAVFTVAVLVHTLPVILGVKSILGIVFIGFGMLQGWRMNGSVLAHLAGPFPLGAPAANG